MANSVMHDGGPAAIEAAGLVAASIASPQRTGNAGLGQGEQECRAGGRPGAAPERGRPGRRCSEPAAQNSGESGGYAALRREILSVFI